MAIYRPRMGLILSVPQMGDTKAREEQAEDSSLYTVHLQIRKANIIRNDHNHADEAHVVADFRDIGVDPRLLANAVGVICIGEADEYGRWEEGPDNARFCGILTRPLRRVNSEGAIEVELEFLDYTHLFLKAKPFGTDGVPDFSQRLDEAWNRIVSQTPGAEMLADRLVFEGVGEIPVLGKAVSSRFAKLSKVPTKPRTDAWAVWQQCVGMMGLISYIHLDRCIVTTATNYYTRQDPPRLIWGRNVQRMEESRDDVYRKGICMTSYDPLTRRAIEGFYPPIGDTSIRKKNIAPKRLGDTGATLMAEEREYFQSPYPTTDKKVLEQIAQRVYEERSRQELEGTVTTNELRIDTMDGRSFDVLDMHAGDSIRIELDSRDKEMVAAYASAGSSIDEMVEYLSRRGYSRTVADIMARNAASLPQLDPTMLVKRVETTLETDRDGGSFEAQVTYCNRLLVSGDTAQ